MKWRVHRLVTATIFVLGSLLLYHAVSPPLPKYKGHTLDEWFQELPVILVDYDSVSVPIYLRQDAMLKHTSKISDFSKKATYRDSSGLPVREPVIAIKAMGTNAIPYLMTKLTQRESPFKKWLSRAALKAGFRRPLFQSIENERAQALSGFLALRPLPPDATIQIQKLTSHSDPTIRVKAFYLMKFPGMDEPLRCF